MDSSNVYKDDRKSLELERASLIVRFSGVGGINKELLPSYYQDRYIELNQILDKPKKAYRPITGIRKSLSPVSYKAVM